MKHAYLSLILGLALLSPTVALAQTGEGDETPPDAEGEASEETEDGTTDEESTDSESEQAEETTAPEPEPEPELSGTEPEPESSQTSDLAAPSVEDDIAEATEDAAAVDAEADAEDEDTGPKLAWRNSQFLWDNSVSTTTFDGGASTLTYNPTYSMAFSVRPRWYLNDDVSLRARIDLSYELTDTDSRALNRELVLADTRIDLVHANVLEYEEAVLSLGGRLYFPTSKASRAYGMIVRPGVAVGVTRPFDVAEGLNLGLSSTYSYRIATSNVSTIPCEDVGYCQARATGLDDPGDADYQVSGLSAVDHEGTIGLSADIAPIEDVTVGTSFTWWWNHGRGLADACLGPETVVSAGGDAVCIPDDSETHTRLLTWFTLSAAYTVNDWLQAELGYSHLTTEFNPSGTRRNPLWSPDSLVSLTAYITLDKLYTTFTETDVEAEVTADDDDSQRTRQTAARRTRRTQQ